MSLTDPEKRSFTDVVADIVDNLQDLVRTEARLVTTELREEAGRAVRPMGRIALGAALAFYGLGFFLATAVILLTRILPLWTSTALVATVVSGVAAGLLINGRRGWKRVHLAPEKTMQSLKENFTWNPAVRRSPRESKLRAAS